MVFAYIALDFENTKISSTSLMERMGFAMALDSKEVERVSVRSVSPSALFLLAAMSLAFRPFKFGKEVAILRDKWKTNRGSRTSIQHSKKAGWA